MGSKGNRRTVHRHARPDHTRPGIQTRQPVPPGVRHEPIQARRNAETVRLRKLLQRAVSNNQKLWNRDHSRRYIRPGTFPNWAHALIQQARRCRLQRGNQLPHAAERTAITQRRKQLPDRVQVQLVTRNGSLKPQLSLPLQQPYAVHGPLRNEPQHAVDRRHIHDRHRPGSVRDEQTRSILVGDCPHDP